MTLDVSNFEEQVLAASHEKPVLVDFWAPWCGPCRQLGPVLEKIAAEEPAAFTLAKLNTDENQAVSARYNIRSIPAVKLFVDGQVVDEFLGALPEPQVRRWLDAALPNETRERLAEAKALLDAGEAAAARAIVEDVLQADASNAEAEMLLARLIVFEDPRRAETLAREAARRDPALYEAAQAVQLVAELTLGLEKTDALPEDGAKAPYVEAVAALAAGDVDAALGRLVASARLNRHYEDDAARRAALALFTVLGGQHPLTRKHRRALEMALF